MFKFDLFVESSGPDGWSMGVGELLDGRAEWKDEQTAVYKVIEAHPVSAQLITCELSFLFSVEVLQVREVGDCSLYRGFAVNFSGDFRKIR